MTGAMSLRRTILAGLALTAVSSMAQASNSELERELQRELHKMPPPATLPLPETLACYERLGKIAQFSPQGRVAAVESVKAVFDVPVIPAGDDQVAPPMFVHCDDPDVQGQGRWVDARHWTYVFTERPGPGVQCQASVDSAP